MINNGLIGNTIGAITSLSLTFVVLSSVFTILAGYAWTTSKGRSVALAFGIVISSVIYTSLHSTALYKQVFAGLPRGFVSNAIVFSCILFLVTFVLNSFVHGSFTSETRKKIFHIVLVSVLTEGVLFSVAYHILAIKSSYAFSSFADSLFGSEYSFLAWLVGLFIGLFFIRGHR